MAFIRVGILEGERFFIVCIGLYSFFRVSESLITQICTDASAALAVLHGLGLGVFDQERLGNVNMDVVVPWW